MKSKTVKKIYREYLLPEFSSFIVKGHLIYEKETKYLLSGFWFESSSFDPDTFTVYAFTQPLYIPSTDYWFNLGSRLGFIIKGKDIWWNYGPDRNEGQEFGSLMKKYGLPYISQRNTLEGITKIYKNSKDKWIMEAVSYAFIYLNEYKQAEKMLGELRRILIEEINRSPGIPWIRDMEKRVMTISEIIGAQNYTAAFDRLNAWRSYTLSNLKI